MKASMVKNTKLEILVTHRIKKSGDYYIAFCPEFLVTTQGKTIEEANNNLKEAVILHLETLDQLGIRDSVFKERNIKILKRKDKTKTIQLDLSSINESYITAEFIPLAC
jgi:predicted RNase H-like HicB family nuclease